MEKKFRITYDTQADPSFVVHMPHRQVKFVKSPAGLYYIQPQVPANFVGSLINQQIALMGSVEENKLLYTPRQVQQAQKARELYQALGNPSLKDFKAIIKMNSISNNPVTLADIKTAETIFGRDIGSLKGKTTRKRPIPVVRDDV